MHDSSAAQLFDVVDGVRRRWRLARVLRGGAVVAVSLVALLLTAAFVLDAVAYAPAAVIAARILALVAAAVLIGWFIVRPFLVPACAVLFWGGEAEVQRARRQ